MTLFFICSDLKYLIVIVSRADNWFHLINVPNQSFKFSNVHLIVIVIVSSVLGRFGHNAIKLVVFLLPPDIEEL